MKKIFNKILLYIATTAIIGLTVVTAINSASAVDPIKLPSIFTPNRTSVDFTEGISGFAYPSFNNFTDNPNIVESGMLGDERKFFLAKHQCRNGGTICCPDGSLDSYCKYYDTLGVVTPLQDGDTVRFMLYFHNNGSDPYDLNTLKNSGLADHPQIGIDLTDIHSPVSGDPATIIRPKGFISARNNQYNNLIGADLSKNGIQGMIATDDMQAFYNPAYQSVELEIVPNSSYLDMNTVGNNLGTPEFSKYISETTSTPITFKTDQGDKTISVLAIRLNDKKTLQLSFNNLPGCFRYSGFAYFDAKVVAKSTPLPPPNLCTGLKILDPYSSITDTPVSTNSCSINNKAVQFKVDVVFKDQAKEPVEQYVKFTTTDPKAKLSLQLDKTYDPAEFNKPYKLTKTYKLADVNWILNGWYEGIGDLKAIYTDKDGFPIEKEKSYSSYYVDIPENVSSPYCEAATKTCPNQCKNICVGSPSDIQEGTYLELSAKTFDYYSDPWTQKITFSTQSKNGKFYKKANLDTNKDGIVSDDEIKAKIKQDFPDSNPQKNTSTYKDCLSQPINLTDAADVLSLLGKTLSNTSTYQYTGEIQFTKQPIEIPKDMGIELYKVPEPIPPKGNIDPAEPSNKYFKNDVFLALTSDSIQPKTIDTDITTKLLTSTKTLGLDKSDALLKEAELSGVMYITVSQNETVWFYADKEGKGVITVTDAVDPTNANCIKTLDISPAPVCKNFTIEATQLQDSSKTVNCLSQIQDNTVKLEVTNITNDEGHTVNPKLHTIKIEWSSTDTAGKFFLPSNPNDLKSSPFTSTDLAVGFKGKGPISAKVISIDGITQTNTPCVWTLPVCDKCGSLSLSFEGDKKEGFVGEGNKNLILNIIQAGTANIPYTSTVKWTDTTGGNIQFPTGTESQKDSTNPASIVYSSNYPYPTTGSLIYSEAKTPGTIKAEVVGEETACSGTLTISNPICQSLTYKIAKADGTALADNLSELDSKDIYLITPQVAYQPNVKKDILINYNASNQNPTGPKSYGYFAVAKTVEIPGTGIIIPIPETDLNKWNAILTDIPVEESVYFFPSQQLTPGKYQNVISIKVAGVLGTLETGCAKTLSILVGEGPAICTEILLKTNPSIFDPTTLTQITIDSASKFGDLADTALFEFKITAGADKSKLYSTKDTTVPGTDTLLINKAKAISNGVYIKASSDATAVRVDVRLVDAAQPLCKNYVEFTQNLQACQEITLKTSPSTFDPTTNPTLWIEGNLGDYKGNFTFQVNPESSARLYRASDPNTKSQTLITTKDEATTQGKIYLTGEDVYTRVSVTATNETSTKCTAFREYTPSTNETCDSISIVTPDYPWYIDDEDHQTFEVEVHAPKPWTLIWDADSDDPTTRFKYGETDYPKDTNTLKYPTEGTVVTVTVEGFPNCTDSITAKTHNIEEPTFKKRVAKGPLSNSSTKWSDLINITGKDGVSSKDKSITYRLDFDPGENDNVNSVKIKEMNFEGGTGTSAYIKGSKDGQLTFNKLEIKMDGETLSSEDDDSDLICSKSDNDPCVTTEDLNNKNDVTTENIVSAFTNNDYLLFKNIEDTGISIYYEMKNNTAVTGASCREKFKPEDGCGETFLNKAYYSTNGNDYHGSDSTTVIALCPYILTRAGGDAFFNSELATGVDVAYCGEQKSIQGPTIIGIEEKDELFKSGGIEDDSQPSFLSHPTHDVCKYSNMDQEGIPEYSNALKSFSSTICEMQAEVSEDWTKVNVVNQIKTNLDKLSRWTETVDAETTLSAPPPMSKGIYKTTKNLTINGSNSVFTIGEKLPLTPAGQTYIIENADLYINSNIEYASSSYGMPNSVPSAAFVVINGNIYIDGEVTRLDGTYIAINTDNTAYPNTGKVMAKGGDDNFYSENQLTINGSLIGDVYDLFSHRLYVGNIAEDQGAVTIRYSENFLINTPPGLSQLMDVTQLKSVY